MCKEILFGVQDRIGEKCMNEKELRYMKCIAEAGSVQKAAVLLRKNPSSLSRAVHRVEEDMDIILFKRTPEGLRPTQEGELYLQAAGEILSMYDELKEK